MVWVYTMRDEGYGAPTQCRCPPTFVPLGSMGATIIPGTPGNPEGKGTSEKRIGLAQYSWLIRAQLPIATSAQMLAWALHGGGVPWAPPRGHT